MGELKSICDMWEGGHPVKRMEGPFPPDACCCICGDDEQYQYKVTTTDSFDACLDCAATLIKENGRAV